MKQMYLLLSALVIAFNAYAQADHAEAVLYGDVKDKTTQRDIPYATIFVKGTTVGTTADDDGEFKLAHVPVGKHTIVAQFLGYKPQEMEVVISKSGGPQLFFELEEDVFNLQQVVVTGTRTQHYVKNVPIRTEVVTSKALKNKMHGMSLKPLKVCRE